MTEKKPGPSTKTTKEDVYSAFDEFQEPVATSKEISELLGVSTQTVLRRLDSLQEEGRVERKDVGSRAVVWWQTE